MSKESLSKKRVDAASSEQDQAAHYKGNYGNIDGARTALHAQNFGTALSHLIEIGKADMLIVDLLRNLDHDNPQLATAISNWWGVDKGTQGKTGQELWNEAREAKTREKRGDVTAVLKT